MILFVGSKVECATVKQARVVHFLLRRVVMSDDWIETEKSTETEA